VKLLDELRVETGDKMALRTVPYRAP